MATNSMDKAGLLMAKKYRYTETTNPERSKIFIQPKSKSEQTVAIIYYLTRNGQLEHPHFIEVPLASPQGLQLRDVTNRLNRLRGEGMASMYSWSSKRRYKNGFVWQDLSESDFIDPCHGHEYILKGSLLLETSLSFRSYDSISSRTSKQVSSEIFGSSSEDSNSPVVIRRKNNSWTTFDEFDEYMVYKAKTTGAVAGKDAENASTQTDDDNKRGKMDSSAISEEAPKLFPRISSSKALERSMGEDYESSGAISIRYQAVGNECASERMKACTVLMKLIRCGSKNFN